ncbi:trafficking protein particle complex subunit 6B isoform X2 [Phyllostomus hastatus]|uniref:trafficking protein particle complex subunit 6B isoform X2 n=1 Tax=Phyllostomus hastatus TaxID=9423 RepID=UPI001E680030|nr:trafficking protein particle complex subunit 6B isoform X2 [Phyllostomus hastatus]
MADEALFLLLHNEMVSGVYKSAEQGEVENGRCITKLENMGFRVGQGLIERFTKDTARFKDELDIMKFICKDFWTTVFKKQIDNLRTNHQGIYVLQDNKFRLLTQMSAGKQYLEHASKKVWKGLQFHFSTFLGTRGDHPTQLWPTDGHKSAVDIWRRFCLYEKETCFENRHIPLTCRGHLVTMRERPKESETMVWIRWANASRHPSILLIM